ncbi:MAG: hypothetical protein P4N60_09120 [Verrucomicrobiae bacterium]|nr:hypothetical protein [Verrucomicrobiae bacterium]
MPLGEAVRVVVAVIQSRAKNADGSAKRKQLFAQPEAAPFSHLFFVSGHFKV